MGSWNRGGIQTSLCLPLFGRDREVWKTMSALFAFICRQCTRILSVFLLIYCPTYICVCEYTYVYRPWRQGHCQRGKIQSGSRRQSLRLWVSGCAGDTLSTPHLKIWLCKTQQSMLQTRKTRQWNSAFWSLHQRRSKRNTPSIEWYQLTLITSHLKSRICIFSAHLHCFCVLPLNTTTWWKYNLWGFQTIGGTQEQCFSFLSCF